jgi:hypothetical protein
MKPDTDMVAIAAVIIVVMFVGMRLLYGYWPWQIHPKLRRVHKEPNDAWPREGFNFQPVAGSDPDPTKPPDFSISPASTAGYKPPLEIDHYDRGYNDNGEDEEPKRSEQEGVENPEADDEGKGKT